MTIDEMLEKDGIENPCKDCGYGPTWAGCPRQTNSCTSSIKYFEKKWDLTCKVLAKELKKKERLERIRNGER